MNIGERIKIRRQELGLSVEELATKLGKNRATVYRYENGDIENLPTSVLQPIANALKTTPAYLMGYEDNLITTDTDIIAEMMKDATLLNHIDLLLKLEPDDKKSVYSMIEFLSKKEGH